jgi:hypothetical protein
MCDPKVCKNCDTCKNRGSIECFEGKPKVFPAQSSICPAYGLFAGEDFKAGTCVCEYLGELISESEGERRG